MRDISELHIATIVLNLLWWKNFQDIKYVCGVVWHFSSKTFMPELTLLSDEQLIGYKYLRGWFSIDSIPTQWNNYLQQMWKIRKEIENPNNKCNNYNIRKVWWKLTQNSRRGVIYEIARTSISGRYAITFTFLRCYIEVAWRSITLTLLQTVLSCWNWTKSRG